MADFFECFACHKVAPMIQSSEIKCPICGSANGQVMPPARVEKELKVRVLYSIDPTTGKREKRRK